MQRYESIFIVRPSLTEEETNNVVDKMKGVLDKGHATVLKVDNWGKRKLAYEVNREQKGTYIYVQFEASGGIVNELERMYRMEDAVLKFLTVRCDGEEPPMAAEKDGEAGDDGIQ